MSISIIHLVAWLVACAIIGAYATEIIRQVIEKRQKQKITTVGKVVERSHGEKMESVLNEIDALVNTVSPDEATGEMIREYIALKIKKEIED